MAWTYQQSTGTLSQNGQRISTGYSGRGEGLNNPDMQNTPNIGPVPQGQWRIGAPQDPPTHLGPLAMPLTMVAGDLFGRDGFFIHGDNTAGNHTASEGCIIFGPAIRRQIADSGDTDLTVIA